jgi:ribosomal protein S18 acetylase RimI-like enzyme
MPLVEPRDRRTIAALLQRNPRAHVYELGDLDDFYWPDTHWLGWEAGGELQQVVLLYTRPEVPVLLAIDDDPASTMAELLTAARDQLPTPLYVHATAPLLDTLAQRYRVEAAAPHLKLALGSTELVRQQAVPAEILGPNDLPAVTALYEDAYPGTWFEPRQLATCRYVGIRQQGRLACVAGVHVYSRTWGVAALGNVATLPALRGRGLARGACAALCCLLLGDGIETIALNVRCDNEAAIRAYTRLGFELVAEYVEASLAAR